jgi:hypothetical protein
LVDDEDADSATLTNTAVLIAAESPHESYDESPEGMAAGSAHHATNAAMGGWQGSGAALGQQESLPDDYQSDSQTNAGAFVGGSDGDLIGDTFQEDGKLTESGDGQALQQLGSEEQPSDFGRGGRKDWDERAAALVRCLQGARTKNVGVCVLGR